MAWMRWTLIGIALVFVGFFAISLTHDVSQLSLPAWIGGEKENPTSQHNPLASPPADVSGSTGSSGAPQGPASFEDTGQTPHYCTTSSHDVSSCENVDEPVCGWYDLSKVNCAPGEPCVRSVFPNSCKACQNDNIQYWTDGDCPLHTN